MKSEKYIDKAKRVITQLIAYENMYLTKATTLSDLYIDDSIFSSRYNPYDQSFRLFLNNKNQHYIIIYNNLKNDFFRKTKHNIQDYSFYNFLMNDIAIYDSIPYLIKPCQVKGLKYQIICFCNNGKHICSNRINEEVTSSMKKIKQKYPELFQGSSFQNDQVFKIEIIDSKIIDQEFICGSLKDSVNYSFIPSLVANELSNKNEINLNDIDSIYVKFNTGRNKFVLLE